MQVAHTAAGEQAKLWNGAGGRAWAGAQALLDQVFQPFEDLLVEAVSSGSGGRVLDVGCGAGSTTLAIARALGERGVCTGIDISEPMIAAARTRAEREDSPATFVRGDAQTEKFEPASFDMIISRFGVMFFGNFIEAFRNLRGATRENGELCFAAWRSCSENAFMTTAERAAAPLLPNIPVRRPDAPGQFAFADQHFVKRILKESGWGGIDIRPIDVACALPEKELTGYLTRLGPLGLALQEADEGTRGAVIETVRNAFEPYVHGAEVRFTAACWMVRAQALRGGTDGRAGSASRKLSGSTDGRWTARGYFRTL